MRTMLRLFTGMNEIKNIYQVILLNQIENTSWVISLAQKHEYIKVPFNALVNII